MPRKKSQAAPELKIPDLYEGQLDELRKRLIKNALKVSSSPEAAAELYHTNPVRFKIDAYRLGVLKESGTADPDPDPVDEQEKDDEDVTDRRSDTDAEEELLDRRRAASGDEDCSGTESDWDGDSD